MYPGRIYAETRDQLKKDFTMEMEGSSNYKTVSILHNQVVV